MHVLAKDITRKLQFDIHTKYMYIFSLAISYCTYDPPRHAFINNTHPGPLLTLYNGFRGELYKPVILMICLCIEIDTITLLINITIENMSLKVP